MNESGPVKSAAIGVGQAIAWLAASAGVLLSLLYIREALLDIWIWYGNAVLKHNRQEGLVGQAQVINTRVTALDFFGLFFLALIGVAATIYIEYYFRKGRSQGRLLRRILTVFLIEVAVIAGTFLVRFLV